MKKIDKNVPVAKGETRGKPIKYPFSEMNVGDSFPITYSEKMSVYSCVVSYNKKNGTSLKVKTGKDETGQLRCWRVE